ncbi:MAG: hypothetical protein ACE5DM_02060 [Candidatus Nanoarchaeia archaeon]
MTEMQDIDAEIEQFRRENGPDWLRKYLNNFHGHLPGGYKRAGRMCDLSDASSEIRKTQSAQEFWNTVDDVVRECEIDPLSILTERNAQRISGRSRLYELILPVYKRLRDMGYNHYPDLTR